MSVGDLLDAVGRVAAVIGTLTLAVGLVGDPVEEWAAAPGEWTLVAPLVALSGSVLLLCGVSTLVLLDPTEWVRRPSDDDSAARLGSRAVLWASTGVAGHTAQPVLDSGVIAVVPLLALVSGLLLGLTWGMTALDRALLLWSTRGYAAGGDPEP